MSSTGDLTSPPNLYTDQQLQDPSPMSLPRLQDANASLAAHPCSPMVPINSFRVELFRCLPENVPPTNLADRILTDFMLEARRDGGSPTACAPCMTCPDVWLLCRPPFPQQKRCASVVVLDILNTYPDIVSLTELAASFIFMFKYLSVSVLDCAALPYKSYVLTSSSGSASLTWRITKRCPSG